MSPPHRNQTRKPLFVFRKNHTCLSHADNSQSAGTGAYQTADSSQNTQTETESTSQSEAAVSAGSTSGSAIASYACHYVEIPYVWGGTSLTSGVDCSNKKTKSWYITQPSD